MRAKERLRKKRLTLAARLMGQLSQLDRPLTAVEQEKLSLAGKILSAERKLKISPKKRRQLAVIGGKAVWAGMGPAERSLEWKRRCKVRRRNQLKRLAETGSIQS